MSIPLVRSPQPGDAASRAEEFATTCRGDIERTWDGYQRLFAAHDIAPEDVTEIGERTEVLARHRATSPGECSTSVYLPPNSSPAPPRSAPPRRSPS